MNPDSRFRACMYGLLAIFGTSLGYFLVADIQMPISPEARLIYRTTQVASEVSGRVVELRVVNNQHVRSGDLLFMVDPESYKQEVRDAELLVEQSRQDNAQLDATINSMKADVRKAIAQVEDSGRELRRHRELLELQYIARSTHDQSVARHDIALAQLAAARGALISAQVQRGQRGDASLRLRRARNLLATAQLSLDRSRVVASRSGIVSNVRLQIGAYAQASQPRLTLIDETPEVHADFREKSLLKVRPGTSADVVFDALPGRVFSASVSSLDAGVARGQIDPDGKLASPEINDRWVRDAERVRVNLQLHEPLPGHLITGARATVQLYPNPRGLPHRLGRIQIRTISVLHYVY